MLISDKSSHTDAFISACVDVCSDIYYNQYFPPLLLIKIPFPDSSPYGVPVNSRLQNPVKSRAAELSLPPPPQIPCIWILRIFGPLGISLTVNICFGHYYSLNPVGSPNPKFEKFAEDILDIDIFLEWKAVETCAWNIIESIAFCLQVFLGVYKNIFGALYNYITYKNHTKHRGKLKQKLLGLVVPPIHKTCVRKQNPHWLVHWGETTVFKTIYFIFILNFCKNPCGSRNLYPKSEGGSIFGLKSWSWRYILHYTKTKHCCKCIKKKITCIETSKNFKFQGSILMIITLWIFFKGFQYAVWKILKYKVSHFASLWTIKPVEWIAFTWSHWLVYYKIKYALIVVI